MKKIFTKLMLLAVAAAALVSCENNYDESTPVVDNLQTVTLSAEKPVGVRTELIEGVPHWSKGDAIGVYLEDETKHYEFTNDAEEATLTTSFTGQTAVANTLFVYYPYTANGVGTQGAKVDIPVNQEPTATSFDGKADIMLAKPVTLNEEGKQVSDLEFARLGAIVKVVLKDNTSSLAGQHVSSLTMTAANNLVGRVYIDVKNQELGALYHGGSKSVTATYSEATQYEVNGTNATYLVVYPQTLAADSKLSFEAATEGYAISKEITLGQDIVLEPGKVTTLNVSLAAENVVAEATGLALPVEDDFAWATGTSSITPSGELWSSDCAYTYGGNGSLRLGKSGECGHITTADLDLSQPFTVVVDAKAWTTETSQVAVTVGDVTQTSANLPAETAGFTTYTFKFDAAGKKEAVKIAITGKRGYIDNFKVVAGHDYVLPPVLTVNVESITSISHEGENVTFVYEVANPVEGTSVVITADAEWLTIADNNGTVTVTVAENTLEEVRNATITVKYGDLIETIAIQQNAKPGEGAPTTVVDVLNVALTGATSTSYISWSGKTSQSTAVYAGSSSKSTDGGIQLRSSSNSGIITTKSGGTARKIVVTWKSSTTGGRTLDIYGKTSAYTATSELYSSAAATQGTKLGSIVMGTSTELEITGNYQYIGLRSKSGAMYIAEIQVTWETGEGGGSTPEPATPVLGVNPTTLSFDAVAGSKTIACTIENEVSGQNVTATESVDWLSTSVSGKTVTVTATANTGAARNATVTIAYTGAESKTVTVSQAAGNTGGGTTGGSVTFDFSNGETSLTIAPITITKNGNTGWRSESFRVNSGAGANAIVFTAESGKTIEKIVFTYTTTTYNGAFTATTGSYTLSSTTGTWTGSSNSVSFTNGSKQARITKAVVTYK